ncbi:MAG: TAXI family TRAP transporter solute-binding subunit [Arcobacteraceae bacterium]|nr:TAXI family TRAP transporter solute-binding subunit [Arcobacteraceae bacterium]
MKKFFTLYLPLVLLVFLAFFITSRFIQPAPERKIVIAAGSVEGEYYKTALHYKKLLEEEKVEVTVLETAGSLENAQLIKEKKADIGFVQSGILSQNDSEQIESLASIYYEPIWIFYKNEGFSIEYVVQLISKKISVGGFNTGTSYLATQILNDNGLNASNTSLLNLSTQESKQKLLNGEIDAMIMVISPDSSTVEELLENPNINVLSIKRAKAYSMKYPYLENLTLHEGTMDLYKNLPYEDIRLLATTANLVVQKDFPFELIRLLLKKAKKIHAEKSLFAQFGQFPNINNLDTTINDEAFKYFKHGDSWLESIFPYWVASNIDRLKIMLIPLLTLLFPLFKGIVPLYTWTMRSKIYKWYDELNDIDKKIPSLSKDELKDTLSYLESLQTQISEHTKVPLSFMGEYYNLLLHLQMLITKIKSRL